MADLDRKPIYDLALECNGLFDKLVTYENDPVGRCREYQEEFQDWADHYEVFSCKRPCLDSRLRNAPFAQDLVVHLLMILSGFTTKLLNLTSGIGNSGTQLQTELNQQKEQKVQHKLILEETDEFRWIVGSIHRLHRLRTVILEGSARSKAIEMLGFANHPDFVPFNRLCSQSVRMLYPYAHSGLKDRLIASMTRRYAEIFHPKSRQSTLQSLPTDLSMPTTINEEPGGSNEDQVSNKTEMARGIQENPTIASQSDLTCINAEQAQGILNHLPTAASRFQQTSSSQFHQENYPKPPEKNNTDTINCEWCSAVLAKETLEPRNWRRHVDGDLTPYLCIADECTEPHPQFSEFDDWFNHMQGHGQHWHQEIYQARVWMCPACKYNQNVFADSHHLLVHLQKYHTEHFTAHQIEAISRQSVLYISRARNNCLLCGYKIEGTAPPRHLYSGKRPKEPPRGLKSKSARTNLDMSHPKSHSVIDDPSSDLDDEGARYDEDVDNLPSSKDTKAMALHIAGHLQMLMLLTIRLASIQNEQETLIEDINSDTVNAVIGDNSSHGQDLGKMSDIDLLEVTEKGSLHRGYFRESYNDIPSEDAIPDSESYNDWNNIPRRDMPPEEEDKFLQQVIKSGAYQSHQRLGFYRCDVDVCNSSEVLIKSSAGSSQLLHCAPHSSNDFICKDVIAKHLRGMHVPRTLSGSGPPNKKDRDLFDRCIENICRRCWIKQRAAPRRKCGAANFMVNIVGKNASSILGSIMRMEIRKLMKIWPCWTGRSNNVLLEEKGVVNGCSPHRHMATP
ncbi:hypothetical protein EMCG_04297 [[Emmonsia] crescens]|uniref:C2H2-type domain-containing protein n=1 Tax=[Emmonsia] crescens TaxID=73230 RepID=A0A0G2J7N5_9EURO|nr:hypothetical protein EMCG_04297 [Emmonsia crescens UAMH 3008]